MGQFVGQDRLAGLRALSLEAEQRGCVTAQDGSEAGGGEARGGGAAYRVGEATLSGPPLPEDFRVELR